MAAAARKMVVQVDDIVRGQPNRDAVVTRDLRGPCRRGRRSRVARRTVLSRSGRCRRSTYRRSSVSCASAERSLYADRRRYPGGFVNAASPSAAPPRPDFLPDGSGEHPPYRKRLLGMGNLHPPPPRSRPDQRRKATRHRAGRRGLLPSRRLVRHDARRPPRHLRARRVPGVARRRSRQLVDRRSRRDPGRRWRDGPRDRRQGASFVMTDLLTKTGEPKLVEHCTYPLTGVGASPGCTPTTPCSTSHPMALRCGRRSETTRSIPRPAHRTATRR